MKLDLKHILNFNGKNSIEVISKLKKLGLFNNFSIQELQELAKIIYIRQFKKNEIIFQENRPGLGMYFIYRGTVKIVKESNSNGYDQSAVLGQGDIVGQDCLFSESPRKTTAIALDDCCLLGIFRPDLLDLLFRKPRFGNKLLLKLGEAVSSSLSQKNDEILRIRDTLSRSNIIR